MVTEQIADNLKGLLSENSIAFSETLLPFDTINFSADLLVSYYALCMCLTVLIMLCWVLEGHDYIHCYDEIKKLANKWYAYVL